MDFNSHLQNLSDNVQQLPFGLTPEDIAHLSNYPSLGKLFDGEAANLTALKNRLRATFQDLERVVLRGTKEDSERAKLSAATVKTTLEFIETLENLRTSYKNS